eukprot:SAG31_NODE_21935_length_537_cov_1.513699_2_plen_27_part_01
MVVWLPTQDGRLVDFAVLPENAGPIGC